MIQDLVYRFSSLVLGVNRMTEVPDGSVPVTSWSSPILYSCYVYCFFTSTALLKHFKTLNSCKMQYWYLILKENYTVSVDFTEKAYRNKKNT